ncbi:MAG: type II secretion system protein [Verrucomicrobiae bacterium]|nr:type II secretion system protein [Verrucomicrobiae bacterium]
MKFNRHNMPQGAERWSGSRRREQPGSGAAPLHNRASSRRRLQGGFTLAEVLAALVFMAIVIPVAVQGLRIASRAGSVSERRAVAVRLAENKLNELIVTGQWQSAAQRGTIEEGWQSYDWRLLSESWSEDGAMRLVTVEVIVPVQGQDYEVRVSTLVDATQ